MILLYFIFVLFVSAEINCNENQLVQSGNCVDACSEGKVIQSGECIDKCLYGYYLKINDNNQEECFEICLSGEYINGPTERGCLICPSHTISTEYNSPSCETCDFGYYPDDSRSECIPCEAGTFQKKISDDPLLYECLDCPINTYQPVEGNTVCLPCVNNTRQLQVGQTTCEDCPIYVSTEDDCCPGYQFQFGICIKCSPGTKSTTEGCQECAPGFFSGDAAITCKSCNSTTEVSIPGNSAITGNNGGVTCSKCPTGRFKNGNTCKKCTLGRFNNERASYVLIEGSVGCKSCPAGQYQDEHGRIDCKYCQAGKSTETLNAQSDCQECPENKVSNVGAEECADDCILPSFKLGSNKICQLCIDGYKRENNQCVECEAGKYGKNEFMYNRLTCLECPLGFAQPNSGSEECVECETNKVATTIGQTQCGLCLVGEYKASSSSCEVCSVGFFSDVEGEPCKACFIGKYQDVTGQQTCKDCLVGKFSTSTGKMTCTNCPQGQIQTNTGQTSCTNCPVAKYSFSTTECKSCQAGFYNNDQGQYECISCFPGEISNEGSTTCTACAKGKYENNNICDICQNNEVPNFNGVGSSRCIVCDSVDCQACPPLFRSFEGACQQCPANQIAYGTECIYCQPGSEFNGIQKICTPCTLGKYRVSQDEQPCQECPIGKYQNFEGKSSCKECNYGQYSDQIGRTNCKLCGVNQVTFEMGSVSSDKCTSCDSGKYVISETCGTCIPGTFINNGVCENCPAGFETTIQNADECNICTIGKAALSGKQCNLCTGYAYQNEEGQESCKTCAVASGSTTGCSSCIAGQYFDETCKLCAVGKWSGIRQKECTECIEGRFQALTGQEYCDKCNRGRYQDQPGKNNCEQCPSGKFQGFDGQKMCMDCLPGQYQARQGQIKCNLCPVGKYSDEKGLKSISFCKNCPAGYYSTNGLCELCTESTYQDIEAQDSCKKCPRAGDLSAEGSTSTVDCFASDGLVSYVFDMKEDSKEEQSLTRECEIRPNLVLLCPGCRCANSARDGFWDGPVCDECQRGYAQSKCKVVCPGYDGKNDDTICSGLGSCWFGKNGNGLCFCGGHSKIDKTAENAVVDVRMCSKGEKCNGYGPEKLDESQYKPIYYLMKYRQFSVYVLKLRTYTPKRGHMWFTRWPRAIAYKNDCRQCVGPYDSSSQQHARTYTGAYVMGTTPEPYEIFKASLQTKNGFHGENCQYECGLCMHGGSCVNVPHPYRFEYTIYDTFERQSPIYVPQTTCVCSSTVYDSSAMCCPKGFQPYIFYGNRQATPYARYSRTPYLTTIEHTEKTFFIDKDLWISTDYGTPDYFVPESKSMFLSDTDQISSVNYLDYGPFGKHIYYGFEKDLCRPCPGLFGKGIRYQEHKVETPSLAEFYWWDASFGAERRKCNGIGVCDFYVKDAEPQVKFMGNAQEYILLKKGYVCSEKFDNDAIYVESIEECIAQKNTEFITMVEPYLGQVNDDELFSLDESFPFTTVDESIAKRFSTENVGSSKIQGPAILKFNKQFKQKGKGRCKDDTLRVEPNIDRQAGLSNNNAALSCAKQCMTQDPNNNILDKKQILSFAVKLGFSSTSQRFCYCQTETFSNCELDSTSNYIFYEWDDLLEHPESNFEVFSVLKRNMPLPKPDTNTKYMIMPTTSAICRGYDVCDLEDLSIKYEITIYSKYKGFGDDRLIESTFDRFDTCFTYTKEEPITLGSYTTIEYENGEDPFVGGLCPKGYFCTETSEEIGFKEACPSGYYQPKQGQTRTDPNVRCSMLTSFNKHCQQNVATKNPNDYVDLVCIRCPRNTYAPEGSYECKECPSGKVKKLSGIPYTPFEVWNTPNKNQNSPWYYVPDEAGTEIEDCAIMPSGVIHIPQLNHMLTYDEHRFLPIVTCPYGFSSPRGTFMFTGDEFADSIYLELGQNTQEPPFAELKYQSIDLMWKHIVTTYCYQCPGNSITGEDSTRCTTCFANQMKKYLKDVIQKSVTKSELQPMHRCCPPATEASFETTTCNSVSNVKQANSVSECQQAAENLIIEYKMRAFGQCENEDGWTSITTRDGCQLAARDLDDISPPVLDFIAKDGHDGMNGARAHPKGCSVFQGYYTYNGKTGPYNYLRWKSVDGVQTPCNEEYPCICKRIARKNDQTTGTNAIAAPVNLIDSGVTPPKSHVLIACEGDCDDDAICQNGLTCWQRETSSMIVPGCNAGGAGDDATYDYCYNSLQVLKQLPVTFNNYFESNTDANRPQGCYIDELNQVYYNNKQGTSDCTGTGGLYGKGCVCLSSDTVRCSEDIDVNRRAASKLGATNDAAGRSACSTAGGEWILPANQATAEDGSFEVRPDRQLALSANNLVNIVVDQADEDYKTMSLGRVFCGEPNHVRLYNGAKSEEGSDVYLTGRCAVACLSRTITPLDNKNWNDIGRIYGFVTKIGEEDKKDNTDKRGRCLCLVSDPIGCKTSNEEWETFKFLSQPTPLYCVDHKCLFQEMIVPPSVEMTPADCLIVCMQVYGRDSFVKGSLESPKTAVGFFDKGKTCLCGTPEITSNAVDDGLAIEYPWDGVRMDMVQILKEDDGSPTWDGLPLCAVCQGGTHTLLTGACDPCEPGTYTADAKDAQKFKCKSCPSGYYQFDKKQTSCLECAVGKNQFLTKQISCDACTRGKYQDLSASAECKECTNGKYQPETAQSSCIDCPKGYKSRSGIIDDPTNGPRYVCDACKVGRYAPTKRYNVNCDICPRGWRSEFNANASTICVVCPAGKKQPISEQGTCTSCLEGKYTGVATMALECKDCPTGWGQPTTEQRECVQCRGGAWCTSVTNTKCPAGKYKIKDDTYNFETQEGKSIDCQACASGQYSSGGTIDCRTQANQLKASIDRADNCRGLECLWRGLSKSQNTNIYNGLPAVCKDDEQWTKYTTGCKCYFNDETTCECCNTGGCQNGQGKCVKCASCASNNKICEWNKNLADGISQCKYCPKGWTTDGDVGRSSCEQCHPEGWTINGDSSARTFSGSCGTSEWPSRHGGSWFSTKSYKTYVRNEVSGPIKCYIRNSCTTNFRVNYKFKGRTSKWYRGYMGYFDIFGFVFGWMWGGLWSIIRRAVSSNLCNRYKYHNKYDSFCSENWGFFDSPGFFSKSAYSFELQQGESSELVVKHQAGTEWTTHLDLWVDCYGTASHSGTPVSLWTQAPQEGCNSLHSYRDSFYHRE